MTKLSYRMLVSIALMAMFAVSASGGARTHLNTIVPPTSLSSSVQQWDFVPSNEVPESDIHKTRRSAFSFQYVFGGEPASTELQSDSGDVVEDSAGVAANGAAYLDTNIDGFLVEGSNEAYQMVDDDEDGDVEVESDSEQGAQTSASGGGPSDHPSSSSPLSKVPSSASLSDVISTPLAGDDVTSDLGMNVRSPMESLKAIWRRLIEAPPSAAQIQDTLQGAPYYTSSQRHVSSTKTASAAVDTANSTVDSLADSANATTASQYSHANPLRANGSDRESMYRQVLSQFLEPLSAAQGKRAQWLDQELALRLKAAVVIAHQPELWRGIGEGLKPQLVRGVRLVTPVDETVAPGPTGVSPVHNIIATALSHSVGANMAFLNLQNVEKVRDSALAVGVDRAFLSKANIITALLEVCEDSFVETTRPAVVVIDDAPQWILANEAASEVVVEELKSVSSRVVFLAISPPDVLRSGDFCPSARPAPVPPPQDNAEMGAEGQSNPMASFASLFNAGNGAGPDSGSRTGTGTVGNNNPKGFVFPPGFLPPGAFFGAPPSSSQRGSSSGGSSGPGGTAGGANSANSANNNSPMMMGMPQMGALIGRSFQVVVQNGTATMIPLPPTIVPGANNLPGGGPLSEAALTKIIQDQHKAFMQQYMSSNNNGTSSGNGPQGISFPLFPPDMTTEEIQEFMQDPDNQAKIKQTLDSVVHALSAQMAQQFGQHLSSLNLLPPNNANTNGGPGASQVPNSPSNPNNVEVKVHMVQMPPGAVPLQFPPPPFARPFKKSADNKTPFAVDKAAPSAIDKAMARDKPPSPSAQNLPGPFFRGLKKRGSADPTGDAGTKGKTRGLKSRAFPENLVNKADRNQGNQGSEVIEAEYANAFSPSGVEITSLFVDYPVSAPRDVTLKALWERLLDDEVAGRILKLNRKVIGAELRRNKVKHAAGAIRALDQILRRQVMSRDEVRQALRFALQLQAGKHSIMPLPVSSIATPACAGTDRNDGNGGGADAAAFTSTLTADTAHPTTAAVPAASATAASTVTTTQPADHQLVLSQWALDTAFSTILKTPTPRLGRPAARSKEDISALVTDKHERSLIGNVISPQDIGVTYDMIGGLDEVKEMLRQCITYPLKYPRLYQEGVAAEAVKGVMLFGPPGTGKTMLAKAVATEGGATFLTIDTSTIENKWLGESEKNARAVFQLARRLAPCVIYLDEVDSILSSREQGDEFSHGTLTSVKTTLMQEWDGLRTTKDRVVVIASTNRPFDLDEAVLRRLPRRILVDLPDLHTRQEILAVTLANNRVDSAVNFTQLAEKLEGYTGSDIKEVCREAVVRVAHERAQMLEHGADLVDTVPVAAATTAVTGAGGAASKSESEADVLDFNAPLRAVTLQDFQAAMRKLKASVDDNGRELQKVVEWNNKYGEFKRKGKKSSSSCAHLTMYV